MEPLLTLDRSLFLKHLSYQTPYIIIDEIADSLLIAHKQKTPESYRALIDYIHNLPKRTINLADIKKDDYAYLAAYINPTASFTKDEIISLAKVLFVLSNTIRGQQCNIEFVVGKYPKLRDATLIYSILTVKGITVPINVTYEDLVETYRYANYTLLQLRDIINFRLMNISMYDAAKLCRSLNPDYQVPALTEKLEDVAKELEPRIKKITYLSPYSHNEAILLAAKNYKINIRLASNPLKEFEKLLWMGHDKYLLSDLIDLQQVVIQKCDPDFLDLEICFDPHLPEFAYNITQLKELLVKMGDLHPNTLQNLTVYRTYMRLQEKMLTNNFYVGTQVPSEEAVKQYSLSSQFVKERGNLQTPETIMGENVFEEENVLVYGVKFQHFRPTTFDELAQQFENADGFINPFLKIVRGRAPELLESESINRLKYLCSRSVNDLPRSVSDLPRSVGDLPRSGNDFPRSVGDSNEISKLRCLTAINRIEVNLEQGNQKTKDLVEFYGKASKELQHLLVKSLYILRDLAMYMRGWKGSESLIHVVKLATHAEGEKHEIFVRVTDTIRLFEKECHPMIANLPLLRYQNGKFNVVADRNKGLSVMQRVQIVKAGKDIPNPHSCIRTSSNYLGASSHRYIVLLGHNPGSEIESFKYID